MRKAKNLLVNVALAVATFVVLFGVTEAILRSYVAIASLKQPTTSADSQTGPDVCGFNAFNQTYQTGIYQLSKDPNLGIELVPGAQVLGDSTNWGYHMPVNINSQGLRENREYSIPKPPDVVRIAIIGDSITFGWGADVTASYPKILERKLGQFMINSKSNKKVEVMNFGVPGYNGKQKLELLKEKVLAYEPDQVIMGWLIDDANPPKYLLGLPFLPNFAYTFLNKHSYLFSCFREVLVKKLTNFNSETYKEQYREGTAGWSESKKLFKEIADISKEKKVPVLIVLLPVWQNFDQNSKDGIVDIHTFLSKTAKDDGLDSLDLLPSIEHIATTTDYMISKTDPYHPNYWGHEIIANTIYAAITGEKAPPDLGINFKYIRYTDSCPPSLSKLCL